ncbi:MAG: intradiol ring-cleavage dioxygenase [Balneolaceae bacterium]|nr:intradiol ring-cleavage dioxygenase [Balneolaceae bacterium]
MKTPILILFSLLFCHSTLAQGTLVGGPCQGCEAVFEYGNRTLSAVDTLPGFEENKPKLKITGTIYKSDGKTPAENVILYIYQTNREGEYATREDEKGWGRRHGYIRGWIKTGADGKYSFYTFKPGSYGNNPSHIHPIILEPNGKYYWLGSYHFADDPKLTNEDRNIDSPRGGSNGILSLKNENGILVGQRDFILGKNLE